MSFDAILLERFTTLYGKPSSPNPAGFIAEYRREFGGIEPKLLQATVNAVIRKHEYPTWPTIGYIHRVMRVEAEHFDFVRGLKALPPPQHKPPTAEEKARVRKLIDDAKRGLFAKEKAP